MARREPAHSNLCVNGDLSVSGTGTSTFAGGVSIDKLLTIGVSTDTADPIELLKFNTERAWSFRKRNSGASTYLALESDVIQEELKKGRKKNRITIFWVGYGVFSVFLLIGLFWFATSEQTATAEAAPIPDVQDLEVYTPLTPTPLPTELPTPEIKIVIGTSWKDGIGGFISSRCGGCHNPVSGRANLDLTSYEGLLEGGDSGPAVVPYAPGISHIILWQRFDWHEVKFSPAEEAILQEWIANGAPEE